MNKRKIVLFAVAGLTQIALWASELMNDWARSKIDDEELEERVNEIIDKREEAQNKGKKKSK